MDLSKYLIALEADDITGEVEDSVNEVTDETTPDTGADAPEESSIASQLDQLDETAGTEEDAEEEQPEEGGEGEEPSEETPPPEEEPAPTQNNDGQEPFMDLNKIRDNLVHLHAIASGEIKSFSVAIKNTNNINTITVINQVLVNLRNVESYSFKIITEDITKMTYAELLEKYISLKRIYELSIQMVEEYFKANPSTQKVGKAKKDNSKKS